MAIWLLVAPLTTQAVGVVVADREWRQLTDSVGWSWDQVATVCDLTNGVCSGNLGSVSFNGWTWAAHTDVQALFDELIKPGPGSIQFPSEYSVYGSFNDPDIAAALGSGAFTPTGVNSVAERVSGISRTDPNTANFARMATISNAFSTSSVDTATLLQVTDKSIPRGDIGFWMYRIVPEPGTLALLGLGLAGLGLSRRRKAS